MTPNNDVKLTKKISKYVLNSAKSYNKTLSFLAADAPISILCLAKKTEDALLNHGCLRVYDLFDLDFAKVKGLNESLIRGLTSRLDEFLAMR